MSAEENDTTERDAMSETVADHLLDRLATEAASRNG